MSDDVSNPVGTEPPTPSNPTPNADPRRRTMSTGCLPCEALNRAGMLRKSRSRNEIGTLHRMPAPRSRWEAGGRRRPHRRGAVPPGKRAATSSVGRIAPRGTRRARQTCRDERRRRRPSVLAEQRLRSVRFADRRCLAASLPSPDLGRVSHVDRGGRGGRAPAGGRRNQGIRQQHPLVARPTVLDRRLDRVITSHAAPESVRRSGPRAQ